jgi:hypothetical protein
MLGFRFDGSSYPDARRKWSLPRSRVSRHFPPIGQPSLHPLGRFFGIEVLGTECPADPIRALFDSLEHGRLFFQIPIVPISVGSVKGEWRTFSGRCKKNRVFLKNWQHKTLQNKSHQFVNSALMIFGIQRTLYVEPLQPAFRAERAAGDLSPRNSYNRFNPIGTTWDTMKASRAVQARGDETTPGALGARGRPVH